MRRIFVGERPEAVEAGTVKLCGVVQDDIVTMAERLIRGCVTPVTARDVVEDWLLT